MSNNIILRKIVDPIFAPPPIINEDGTDAHATNKFARFLHRSEVLFSLLASTSAFAISATLMSPDKSLGILAGSVFGIGASLIFSLAARNKRPINVPKYYLDRTKAQKEDASEQIYADLLYRKKQIKREAIIRATITVPVLGIVYSTFGLSATTPVIALVVTDTITLGSAFWRAKRGLDREWKIHETLPLKPKEKTQDPNMVLRPT